MLIVLQLQHYQIAHLNQQRVSVVLVAIPRNVQFVTALEKELITITEQVPVQLSDAESVVVLADAPLAEDD